MADVCLIEDSVATALVSWPIKEGWTEGVSGFELVAGLRAETVIERDVPALLGSVDAALLLDRFSVVTDFALVSRHNSPIALWTPTRPDEVDNVAVALDGVSRTAEAVARATLHNFYGITVTDWDRQATEGEAVVVENEGALRLAESGELSDLIRAWYILTNFPLPTHLLVVPKVMTESTERVAALVSNLKAAADVGVDRRREVRRDLAQDERIDRDRLVDFQNDQAYTLSKTARKAWLDLLRRTERAMKLPAVSNPDFVTLGAQPEQDG